MTEIAPGGRNFGLKLGRFISELLNRSRKFFRRCRCLSGPRFNLARHNRGTFTVVAGARRFDRRVQCQKIGLAGDFFYLLGNLAHVLTLGK